MFTKTKSFFKKALGTVLSAACLFSGTAVASTIVTSTAVGVSAAGDQGGATFSWDNATVYFLLTDRFYNGNTSNDNSYGRNCNASGTPVSGWSKEAAFQGGDFAGITKKINDGYFTNLGVNAIWLSAPYEQIHGYIVGGDGNPSFAHYSYHGYYVLDYTEPDLNFGTREEFATMVETAHQNGIRIVLDIVMNHAGYQSLADMSEFGFGPLKSGWDSYYYAHQNVKNELYHGYIDYNGSNAQSEWAKWWGSDWIRCGLAGYTPGNDDDDIDKNLASLPDFKTGSNTQVGIPDFLKRKWQKEGTYDAKISKYGSSNTVRGYIISWLSDWVRTYGIDGFRCDTAKHVELSAWNELKQSAKSALKEWRQNNPSKPGADWTDEFWMTGECWGHKAEKSPYFTTGGFDSMINFEFTGVGSSNTPAAGSVDGVYSRYATAFNNDPQFNMLTYLASHDTSLIKGDRKNAGSFLLMCPGGVQIYYGDEINRPVCQVNSDSDDGAGHKWRSFMNWDSMDQGILSHWQKLGQFRNNHLSVGAGQHQLISAYDSTNGYTFARTYSKGDIDDKIVATLFASPNTQVTINVNGIFAEGTEITNFYDDTTAKVSGGKVTFNSGANGTILLQEPAGKKGRVNVTHINQDTGSTIKTEVLSGLVGDSYTATPLSTEGYTVARTEGQTTGTYSETEATVTFYYTFDSSNYGYIVTKHVDSAGAELAESVTTVGKVGSSYTTEPVDIKDYEVDLTKSTNISGTVKSGTTTATYVYNYVEPTNAKVHYYNANGWSTVNMYAYTGDGATATQLLGAWPGKAMTQESNGWFVCEVPDVETCRVLFNAGANGPQEPGQEVPGYEVTGEVWLKDGKATSASKVTVLYTSTDGKTLGTEILKGVSGDTYQTTAKEFSGYKLKTTPDNATGTYGATAVTVTYVYEPLNPVDPLTNNSTISAQSAKLNASVTVTGAAAGGTAPYQYAYYSKGSDGSWTTVKDFSDATSCSVKMTSEGTMKVKVTVKDSEGSTADKEFSVTVSGDNPEALVNNSTLSASTVAANNAVYVKCAASGGKSPYSFAVYYKAPGDSAYSNKLQDYSTNANVKFVPTASGTHAIRVSVKDSAGTVELKYLTLKVTEPPQKLVNNSTASATSIKLGASVTLNFAASGGTTPYYFAVYYKKTGMSGYSLTKDYDTARSYVFTPKSAADYSFKIRVMDTAGTTVDKYITVKVINSLVNKSTISSETVQLGKTVTITGAASGGTTPYQYALSFRRYGTSSFTQYKGFSTTKTITFKPAVKTTYVLRSSIKDSSGKVATKDFTVKVTPAPLVNNSKAAASAITLGKTVKITFAASGGTTPYKYALFFKKAGQSTFTQYRGYSTTATASFKPQSATTYTLRTKVKDNDGKVTNKDLTLKVTKPLTNVSKLSATTVTLGKSITMTGAATGGTSPYKYALFFKKAGQSSFTKYKDFSTTKTITFKPQAATTYTMRTKVKDSKGTVAYKDITLKVVKPLTNTSKASATTLTLGKTLTITGSATGGVTPYKYALFFRKYGTSTFTKYKDYSTTKTISFKPMTATTYILRTKVKDNRGIVANKDITVKVVKPLTNTSKASAASITLGKSLTITGSATGGVTPYKYALYFRKYGTSTFTKFKDYSTTKSITFKPLSATTYILRVKVKDNRGVVANKDITVKVLKPLKNTSTVSATSLKLGNSLTVTGSATGGATPYQYALFFKKGNDSSFTQYKALSSTNKITFKPASATTYTLRTKVKDGRGVVALKDYTVKVTK